MRTHRIGFALPLAAIASLSCAVFAPTASAQSSDAAPASAPASPAQSAAPAAPPSAMPGTPNPANQVIEPEVDRRNVRVTHIPSNDIEVGLFTGTYDTQNFGTNLVGGLRLGYHITEDVFAEAVYGQTKVSDQDFRLILPGGIFPQQHETLRYYDASVGYNVLPGEVFIGRTHAKVSAVYLIGGFGITKFDAANHETVNVGTGMRVFLADWVSLQIDARDHFFSLNLLGQRQETQNLELTAGVTFFF